MFIRLVYRQCTQCDIPLTTSHSYWNETLDSGKFSSSPVFDKVLGFGGSGQGANNCVLDGPFANLTVNIGPGFTTQPRCVNRKITDGLSSLTGKTYVDQAKAPTTFWKAQDALYSGPRESFY